MRATPGGAGMTIDEIIELYQQQKRPALAQSWESLRRNALVGVREVRHFDPFLWTLDHHRVTAPSDRRDRLVAWCHDRATGRWMFNELASGDLYLFEKPLDAESFQREAGAAAAPPV
jgi:hypothetical protein